MTWDYIGKSVNRLDAEAKVTGQTQYVSDVDLPRMAYGKILGSPYSHARIKRIDTRKAEEVDGVLAVITARNIQNNRFGTWVLDQPIFTEEKVRHVGEPVAAVAALDEKTAARAVALIEVEYEELPAVYDPIKAMEENSPLVHDNYSDYFAINPGIKRGHNICMFTRIGRGDVNRGMKEADFVFEDHFTTQPAYQAPLEVHVATAKWEGKQLTVWASTQQPFVCQMLLGQALGIPLSQIRVIATRLGGGFGGKMNMLVEPYCALLARKTGRPVQIALSREEDFRFFARLPAKVTIQTGVKKDGTILARKIRLVYDTGAYATEAPGIVCYGASLCSGPYAVPNLEVEAYAVLTNNGNFGPFRGYGVPQVTFAYESQMDMIAQRLNIDPAELRRKNLVEHGQASFVTGEKIQNPGLAETLSRALAAAQWESKRPEKQSPGKKRRGIGLACIHNGSGALASCAFVQLKQDGSIGVHTGAVELGSGVETVLAQIVAEELGVPVEKISLLMGDTDGTPYDWGIVASRGVHTAGTAVLKAAQDAKQKIKNLAAGQLGVTAEQLTCKNERVFVKNDPDKGVSMWEMAIASHFFTGGPILGSASFLDGGTWDFNINEGYILLTLPEVIFCTHVVEVEVDTETGEVNVIKAVAAHDVGKAINPRLVEGQIEGGFVQGMGFALTEEVQIAEGRIMNASLADYVVPTAQDVPEIVPIIVETEGTGPFGANGAGEPPIIAPAPAIANAIANAIGVRFTSLPITPEKILQALEGQK